MSSFVLSTIARACPILASTSFPVSEAMHTTTAAITCPVPGKFYAVDPSAFPSFGTLAYSFPTSGPAGMVYFSRSG